MMSLFDSRCFAASKTRQTTYQYYESVSYRLQARETPPYLNNSKFCGVVTKRELRGLLMRGRNVGEF